MGLRKYTVAEFRKNIREAFNAIDNGNSVYITRHGVRYEVRKADVQPGKKQIADMNAKIGTKVAELPDTPLGHQEVYEAPLTISSAAKETIDNIKSIEYPAPKKNIADADASEVGRLQQEIATKQAELDKIDINTQDFDEIERGSQLAADLDTLRRQLAARGV
jgi:hypothetical protein